jgi:OmcA/MtrC family decaheme c-type cytochrome
VHAVRRETTTAVLIASAFLMAPGAAQAQETPLAWDAAKYFQFNIENVILTGNQVKTIFSVSNPADSSRPFWDIKNDAPFKGGRSSRLGIDVGWDPSEYTNTGSNGGSLSLVPAAYRSGIGAALPIQINALTAAQPCANSADCPGVANLAFRYWVTATLAPIPFPANQQITTGVVVLEGHPACPSTLGGCPAPTLINGVLTLANVPVTSASRNFSLTGSQPASRRQIVDINKCKVCHNGAARNGTVIPRLSLHGGNRTENLAVCVVCHNPDQTDIPYRTSGAEVSLDFKRMVHGIHAGGFRKNPLVIVGFQGSVNDFSTVRFPSQLRNCLNCHVDINGKGTFELPLQPNVLGSTINTRSMVATVPNTSGFVDVDPFNDLKITPTAAVCSSCHDSEEVQSHMIRTGGASFGTLQQNAVAERCVRCHGPGREEDVRKAHEIGRSGSSGSGRADSER